jgi:hypothetical protein
MPDLTGIPALDLAVGMSFVFLLLSLLASAVQEWIASLLALRASTLEKGLRSMLEKDTALPRGVSYPQTTHGGAERNLVNDLYAHPLVRALYTETWWPLARSSSAEGNARLPSYISPRTFALALSDTIAPNAYAGPDVFGQPGAPYDVLAAIRSAVFEMNVPPGVKHRLIVLVDEARGDIDTFRRQLEAWFDDTMARVSGWYKRQTQLILAGLAVVITITLNANTLTIGNQLWRDPSVRAAVVQQASSPSVTGQTQGGSPEEKLRNAANNVDSVAKLGVPLGWSANKDDPRHVSFTDAGSVIAVLGGWFLTIAAVSLGAPFWFDFLSRVARLRSSGKPETPLPASGHGQPNERVFTQTPPLTVNVHPQQSEGAG